MLHETGATAERLVNNKTRLRVVKRATLQENSQVCSKRQEPLALTQNGEKIWNERFFFFQSRMKTFSQKAS